MHTYRVWFRDGTAVMVDAETEEEARTKANTLKRPGTPSIRKVETLN